jgi:uncharacterized protein
MSAPVRLSTHEREALAAFRQELARHHRDRVQPVFLFGSKARGDAGPDSDVDVLVALTTDDPRVRSDVRRLAARISLEYGLLISVRAAGRSRWAELARYRFPLYQAIQAEGIDLDHV